MNAGAWRLSARTMTLALIVNFFCLAASELSKLRINTPQFLAGN